MPLWKIRRPAGRNLAQIAQGRTEYPTKEQPDMPPPAGPQTPHPWWDDAPPAQTPRIGLSGPMPDYMPGAWNAAGRGGRKPHWNDPSGRPYAPGPRPGIDYDTRGSAPTFDDWLMNWSKRFGG